MRRIMLVIAGLCAGFVTTALLSILTTTILRSLWPAMGSAGQGVALETLDFVYALAYMGVGGYVSARIGGTAGAFALGAVFVILGLATAVLQLDSAHSAMYLWLMAVGAGGAVWIGARVAARKRTT